MENPIVIDHWQAFQGCVEPAVREAARTAFLRFAACGPHPAAFWDLLAFVRPGARVDDLYWSTVCLRTDLGRPLGHAHFRALFSWAARCCRDAMTHEQANQQVALARIVASVMDDDAFETLRDFLTILDEDLCDQAETALLREFALFAEALIDSLDSVLQLEEPWTALERLPVIRHRFHAEFAVWRPNGARVADRLWTECMLPIIELREAEARREAEAAAVRAARLRRVWFRDDMDEATRFAIMQGLDDLIESINGHENGFDPDLALDPDLAQAMRLSLHDAHEVPAHLLADQLAPAA